MNAFVAYFSASGITAKLAEKLQAANDFGESRILLQIGEGGVEEGQLKAGAQSFTVYRM